MNPILSLCIPTNGVIQWVFNSLDSIYSQGVAEELFEVIVADNGNNAEFNKLMVEYVSNHKNLVYKKTTALPFMNEIEAYKLASGRFIKYLNHRSIMKEGSLTTILKFVEEKQMVKPVVYFANGVLNGKKDLRKVNTFDEFIRELSYFSTWSTGMAFWKEDFDKIMFDENIDVLFPHTKILFHERGNREYIVDNQLYFGEQPVGNIPKANYDLFYAFAVDYPALLLELRRSGDITTGTFLTIKRDLLGFLADLYFSYCILKQPCSYDLNSFNESVSVLYNKSEVNKAIIKRILSGVFNRLFRFKRGKK